MYPDGQSQFNINWLLSFFSCDISIIRQVIYWQFLLLKVTFTFNSHTSYVTATPFIELRHSVYSNNDLFDKNYTSQFQSLVISDHYSPYITDFKTIKNHRRNLLSQENQNNCKLATKVAHSKPIMKDRNSCKQIEKI